MDSRRYVRQLRDMAVKLLEIAAEMDEPRTVATTRARGCTCDVCGSQITGSVFDGARCESTRTVDCVGGFGKAPCPGRYRLDPEPVTDRAGNDLDVPGRKMASEEPRTTANPSAEPDEELTTWCDECRGTGKSFTTYTELHDRCDEWADCLACKGTGKQLLGVSLADLAAVQAIRDFRAEDPDNDDEITDEWPDIASTYRGRRA